MLLTPTNRSRELQRSVIAMRVVFDAHPADLDHAFAVTADAEVNRVGGPILRQVRAMAGVTEITAVPEFLVGRCDALVAGSGAMPGETVAERKASAMRPHLGIVPNRRKEIRTGQEPSQTGTDGSL